DAELLADELREPNQSPARTTRDVEAILGSIADPFVVHDRDWRFRYVNAAAREIFKSSTHGEADKGLLGVVVWDAYPALVGTGIEQTMREAVATGKAVTREEFYPQGGKWSEIRCYPMPDGGLATSWRDITARKRAEEAAH